MLVVSQLLSDLAVTIWPQLADSISGLLCSPGPDIYSRFLYGGHVEPHCNWGLKSAFVRWSRPLPEKHHRRDGSGCPWNGRQAIFGRAPVEGAERRWIVREEWESLTLSSD